MFFDSSQLKCIISYPRWKSEKNIQFTNKLDFRHTTTYEGIKEHGHYCLPILFGERLIGVLNLYIKEAHLYDAKETEFLNSVADIIASIVIRQESSPA